MEDREVKGFIKTPDLTIQNFKVADKKERIIEGFFTTTDLDRGGDVSLTSAFEKTITEYMKNPILTYMHSLDKVMGKVLEYSVVADKGIWIKAQVAKDVKWIDEEVWPLMDQGIIKGFSYGYSTKDEEKGLKEGKEVNYLKEVELFEIAVVTLPMNANALFNISSTGTVKSMTIMDEKNITTPETKALSHNSNVADSEPAWSSVDKTSLPRNAFADMGEPDKSSTWKYPHHWVSNGTMYLHKGGLNAAWAAAHGARSGVDAESSVVAHLSAHRKALGLDNKKEEELSVEKIDELLQGVKTLSDAVTSISEKFGSLDAKAKELVSNIAEATAIKIKEMRDAEVKEKEEKEAKESLEKEDTEILQLIKEVNEAMGDIVKVLVVKKEEK
jgi:HK97 family phage prohead protease